MNLFDYVLNVTKMFALKALNSNSGIIKNKKNKLSLSDWASEQASKKKCKIINNQNKKKKKCIKL